MDDLNGVEIGTNNILAAVLSKVGSVQMTVDDLTKDYSEFQIELEKMDEHSFSMRLVKVDA